MKKNILFIFLIIGMLECFAKHILQSPDNRIEVTVNVENTISFSVSLNGVLLIKKAVIDLIFDSKSVYSKTPDYKTAIENIDRIVKSIVPFKDRHIPDIYHMLSLDFGDYGIEFRAYNDGVAYRHITKIDREVKVNESAIFTFNENYKLWASPVKGYQSSYEVPYQQINIADFSDTIYTYLPLLIDDRKGNKILLTEADIYDYPHMFLRKREAVQNQLTATFPPYPLATEFIGDRGSKITKEASYIAKTHGKRTFPWRVMVVTDDDSQLVASNLVFLLSRDKPASNAAWVKPGRVSWEWWNASNLYGVDFESSINTKTYKYYIDFAAKNGLEYILLDEGWSKSILELSRPNPSLDLTALIAYGKEKNVSLILWLTWVSLHKQWDILDRFQEWGIAGIKVDFMNRSDQWMVNFYEKVVRETAKRQLLVDFHGASKPHGLRRAYPNVLTFEGVCGLEHSKWSKANTPALNVSIPFIRMVCGPMDYTPGAMRNFHTNKFSPSYTRPGSQGTRCHQVALFIVCESGLQMFCDSPSNYEREQETTDFLASIPAIWDETKVLKAKVGEYLVIARRNGNKWFVGGLTNNEKRDFTIDLSFLESKKYKATIMKDGINAEKFAEDYQLLEKDVSQDSKIIIKMMKGGGFAMRIE